MQKSHSVRFLKKFQPLFHSPRNKIWSFLVCFTNLILKPKILKVFTHLAESSNFQLISFMKFLTFSREFRTHLFVDFDLQTPFLVTFIRKFQTFFHSQNKMCFLGIKKKFDSKNFENLGLGPSTGCFNNQLVEIKCRNFSIFRPLCRKFQFPKNLVHEIIELFPSSFENYLEPLLC